MGTTPARAPIPIADRIGEHPPHQRATALEWLYEKIAAGEAGLDPFDARIVIVDASEIEIVWAYRMIEQTGKVLVIARETGPGRRYKACLDDDARHTLGLDTADAAVMEDEPLASRGVDAAQAPLDAILRVLPQPPLRLIEGEAS